MTAEKSSPTRPAGGPGWNIWRGLVGFGYLAATAFNLFYTLPEADLSWLADDAWYPALAALVHRVVVPNHGFLMSLVVLFETVIGVLILSRGRMVDIGVGASVVWVVLLIPLLQPLPKAATNVGLALVQGILLLHRYDMAIWEIIPKTVLRPFQLHE